MRGCGVPFLLLSNFILPENLKRGDFSNESPLILGVSGARRYPTDRTTTNKRVLGRKIRRGRDSPCINFLTEILPGPALAVFAFQPTASNSHNAAGFQSLRNTKQLVLLHSPGNQKPRLRGVLDFYGVCSLVSNMLLVFVPNSLIRRENTGKMLIFRVF